MDVWRRVVLGFAAVLGLILSAAAARAQVGGRTSAEPPIDAPAPAALTPLITPPAAAPAPPPTAAPTPPPSVAPSPTPAAVPVGPLPEGAANPQDPPPPVVTLRVRAPALVEPGQNIEYHLYVENRSSAPAHHVVVRNPLPPNTELVKATPEPAKGTGPVVWEFGTLAPGACQRMDLVLKLTGPGDTTNCARVQFEFGECVVTRIARPALSLQVTGPTTAGVDEPLACQVVVTNSGNAPVTGVQLTLPLPDGLESPSAPRTLGWQQGVLKAGESKRFTFQAVAKQAGEFRAEVRAVAGNAAATDAAYTLKVGAPQLTVTAEGPPARSVGEAADYKITVANDGPAPARNIVVTDFLPADVTAVAASDGGRVSHTQVHWQIAALAPGARKTLQLATRAEQPAEAVHKLTVEADHGVRAQGEVKTRFTGTVGLKFAFQDGPNTLAPNAPAATYTVVVENTGTAPAEKVRIRFVLPDQLAFVNAIGKTDYQADAAKKQIEFAPIESLPPRQSARYEVVVTPASEGDVRLRAELVSDSLSSEPVRRQHAIQIYGSKPEAKLQDLTPTPPAAPTPAPTPPADQAPPQE